MSSNVLIYLKCQLFVQYICLSVYYVKWQSVRSMYLRLLCKFRPSRCQIFYCGSGQSFRHQWLQIIWANYKSVNCGCRWGLLNVIKHKILTLAAQINVSDDNLWFEAIFKVKFYFLFFQFVFYAVVACLLWNLQLFNSLNCLHDWWFASDLFLQLLPIVHFFFISVRLLLLSFGKNLS